MLIYLWLTKIAFCLPNLFCDSVSYKIVKNENKIAHKSTNLFILAILISLEVQLFYNLKTYGFLNNTFTHGLKDLIYNCLFIVKATVLTIGFSCLFSFWNLNKG